MDFTPRRVVRPALHQTEMLDWNDTSLRMPLGLLNALKQIAGGKRAHKDAVVAARRACDVNVGFTACLESL
jgi:hypothetical protein